ncbi:hypothetical protein [Pontibacter indicus]|uniref:Uncharacterized protein n=1 Tax=Pontibacter indicus TaxID=1317125 RepID=A0A1R3XPX4_9BACT|nr:hypothetical protein [Pontibacter indicus]SIT93990.1 hypothetical protein SAMN05444128_3376 [Pontibacter indicus]
MDALLQLNTTIPPSDRKYSYGRVLTFLEQEEEERLGLSPDMKAYYGAYRERLKALNQAMFRPGADHGLLLADLQALEAEVAGREGISPFLRDYLLTQVWPKTAYCHYKRQDFGAAEQELDRKFERGIALCHQGFYFQFFDLLEQVLNLSKLQAAQQQMAACVHNWTELFRFLVQGSSEDPLFSRFNQLPLDTGLYRILKEYTILNFLNIYLNGYMKFGGYPNPSELFSGWYQGMEVDTSERLALYQFIALQESARDKSLAKLTGEVVEFSQLFPQKNYLLLRCALLALLVGRLEEAAPEQGTGQALLLRDYLQALETGIPWVQDLINRLTPWVRA